MPDLSDWTKAYLRDARDSEAIDRDTPDHIIDREAAKLDVLVYQLGSSFVDNEFDPDEAAEDRAAERAAERADLSHMTIGDAGAYLAGLAADGCTGAITPLPDGRIHIFHDGETCPIHETGGES